MSCCPPKSAPAATFDTSDLVGEMIRKDGLDMYFSKDKIGTGKGIIVAYDVVSRLLLMSHVVIIIQLLNHISFSQLGMDGGRQRHICDELASHGYSVIMPDFFDGDNCVKAINAAPAMLENSEQPDFANSGALFKWIANFDPTVVEQRIQDIAIPFLKEQGCDSFAMVGFCWGAWVALRATSMPNLTFNASLSCHPAFGVEGLWGGDVLDLVKKVNTPQLVLSSGPDDANTKPGAEIQKILTSNGLDWQGHEYKDMVHGWMDREKPSDAAVDAAQKDSMNRMLQFLKKHM